MKRSKPAAIPTVDHFTRVEGLGIRGATVKDVLKDPESGAVYIAKLGRRRNDLEVMTEYAIYLIGRSLGVRVADARIARYSGQLRFLSRYFLDPVGREELVHGVQLFKELYDQRAVDEVLGKQVLEQEMFSVQAVRAAFGAHYLQYGVHVEDELFGAFVRMLAHDALIGVQDRHHENWGVIVQREVIGAPPRFAPLYDSARGLFCNQSDQELRRFTGREGEQRLDGFVARARPLVGFQGLKPVAGRRFLTHAQLLGAVFRAYPNQRANIMAIVDSYDWRAVREFLATELAELCSPFRRTLILTCLRRRVRGIRRTLHGSG